MRKIFLSYRRADSQYATDRIYDVLSSHFGRAAVFMDIDKIPLGVNFQTYINEQVQSCDVVLAIIGNHWLRLLQERIEEPNDFVRLELEAAFSDIIIIVPVFIAGVQSLPFDSLPKSLNELSMLNAASVRRGRDFENDSQELIKGIEQIFAKLDAEVEVNIAEQERKSEEKLLARQQKADEARKREEDKKNKQKSNRRLLQLIQEVQFFIENATLEEAASIRERGQFSAIKQSIILLNGQATKLLSDEEFNQDLVKLAEEEYVNFLTQYEELVVDIKRRVKKEVDKENAENSIKPSLEDYSPLEIKEQSSDEIIKSPPKESKRESKAAALDKTENTYVPDLEPQSDLSLGTPPQSALRENKPLRSTSPRELKKSKPDLIKNQNTQKKPNQFEPSSMWGWGGSILLIILVFWGIAQLDIDFSNSCPDDLGCVEYGPDDPIVIASALVISGRYGHLGLDSQYGVEVAIAMKGEIFGHIIELQAEDDGCSAEGGQAAGEKIVTNPSIVAIVGTSCAGAAVPMSQIITKAGYLMVSPSNTAPSLTDPDQAWNPGYYRTSHNDKVQGVAMAKFAYEELDLKSAATIHDGDPYTEGIANAFADAFKALGGTVTLVAAVNNGDTDMIPVLTSVAADVPDFLFFPVFTETCALLAKQARDVDALVNITLAAADGCFSAAAAEAIGDAGDSMYFSGPDIGYSGDAYDEFLAMYAQVSGEDAPISVFHAHAFDAANLILSCIEEVGQVDSDGTLLIGRQALRDCLSATSGYVGITGSLTCNEYGDCGDPKIAVFELVDGEYEFYWK